MPLLFEDKRLYKRVNIFHIKVWAPCDEKEPKQIKRRPQKCEVNHRVRATSDRRNGVMFLLM